MKQETYGEILTTGDVLERLREAEQKTTEKRKQSKQQSISKKKKTSGEIVKKSKNSLRKNKSSDERGEESNIDYESDYLSPMEEDEEEAMKVTPIEDLKELKNGSFVLASFKGGQRNSALFRYVCSVEKIEGSEVEVIGLRNMDETKTNITIMSSDVSFVQQEQLIGLLHFPEIQLGVKEYFIISVKESL